MTDQLPILEIIPDIKKNLVLHNTIILQAPPGAGKSTILPLQLLDEPWLKGKKILMLEPRRLAARAVANRMSSLINEQVGTTVGYRVRFDNKVSKQTRIEVLTEGILTRMLQHDNTLEDVGLVIFDEFHERSLHADLALALCREMQQVIREDLRILIMSATLDGEKLSSLLGNAPVLTSAGRQYPIELFYLPQENISSSSLNPNVSIPMQTARAVRKALAEHEGDILVFLPGAGEIQRTQELLEQELSGISIQPLFGDLPLHKQQEAILPHPQGKRKVVLSTSIAETSLTIEGIKIVIDSGYCRAPRFDPKTGLTRLDTIRVTQDMATQRAGRAGRTSSGICYRLWNQASHQHLLQHRNPEILEADLAPTIIELAQWGIQDLNTLAWLSPPPPSAVSQAQRILEELGALNASKITKRGKEMLRLPTHPRIAHLLLEGQEYGLIALATDVAAILEERDPLQKEAGANLTLRIEALRKWRNKEYVSADKNVLERIERLAAQWRKHFSVSQDNTAPVDQEVGKLLAAAYPERIAKQREQSHRYRLSNGKIVKLNEHDPLSHETYLAVAHLDAGTAEGRIYLAAPLSPDDILHLATEKKVITWDVQNGILVARNEKRIGDIILESKPLKIIPEEERIKILCDVVRKEGLTILNQTEQVFDWKARLSSIKAWRPDEDWPDVSDENLLNTLEEWLAPYIIAIKKREEFLKLDLYMILSGLLSYQQTQQLETIAPSKIKVPSGSMISLAYQADGTSPVLAVRLQEMFGLLDTPTVNEGRIKVILHFLSPGYKPVQITQDLKSFWKNAYPEVRKELRIQYKRHHWPEDPWTAEAMAGAKKRGT
ncbi:MAG: ATP-dependent helicase HrpB [Bacteroidota bacterium]|nr:ATP-dependent helicase HrpB [Bacteroidota bacterium]